MKTAQEIVDEVKACGWHINKGVRALAKKAYDDPDGFCIMDDDQSFTPSYREECLDRCSCQRADYMLACIQTREHCGGCLLGEKAVRIYNEVMSD